MTALAKCWREALTRLVGRDEARYVSLLLLLLVAWNETLAARDKASTRFKFWHLLDWFCGFGEGREIISIDGPFLQAIFRALVLRQPLALPFGKLGKRILACRCCGWGLVIRALLLHSEKFLVVRYRVLYVFIHPFFTFNPVNSLQFDYKSGEVSELFKRFYVSSQK